MPEMSSKEAFYTSFFQLYIFANLKNLPFEFIDSCGSYKILIINFLIHYTKMIER